MDSPPKLTGETLIVHHIPLVHCQVPDRQRCSSSKRSNPFCQRDLGITRTTSLPERHLSETDSLLYSSLGQAIDPNSGSSDEVESQEREFRVPVSNKRHNPFLFREDEDDDDSGEEAGQTSFHLHNTMSSGRSSWQTKDLSLSPFHLHETSGILKPWNLPSRSGVVDGQEAKFLADGFQKRNNANQSRLAHECMEMDEYSCHHDGSSVFSLDQEWNNSSDESMRNQELMHSRTCSCSSSELQHCRCYSMSSQSEIIDHQMGYISDSSCNSSDGVLVNFSALYNKMNGHTKSNMNSGNLSCDSSFCSHSDTGAFYLDLHSSPAESKMSCDSHLLEGSGKSCGCRRTSSPLFDANCNSYHLHCDPVPCQSESSDLTSCFQSQARLVVATQNYYKLVTCDLSSQSSPSPEGSSITSCSEDHAKGSPLQPTEYYLFRRPEVNQEKNNSECCRKRSQDERLENAIEGQVYVNVSPPNPSTGRQRSRSYDRSLDKRAPVRPGSLERMMSCPVKLSASQTVSTHTTTTRRVTSFAELAKSRKKTSFSPPLRMSGDSSMEFSPIPEFQSHRPVFSDEGAHHSQSLPTMPFIHCLDHSCEECDSDAGFGEGQRASSSNGSGSSDDSFPGSGGNDHIFQLEMLDSGNPGFGHIHRDTRAKADGVVADGKSVFRYSKDQRPTTLPIQPFVFQHHFSKQMPKVHPLHSHFASSLSQLYSLSSHRAASTVNSSESQSSTSATSAGYSVAGSGPAQTQCTLSKWSVNNNVSAADCNSKKSAPETTRPSPLGSYSPVRNNEPFFESMDSSSDSPPSERANEFHPPRSRSCPISANLLTTRASPARAPTLPGAAHTTPLKKAEQQQEKLTTKPPLKKGTAIDRNAHMSKYAITPSSLPPVPTTGRALNTQGGHLEQTRSASQDNGKKAEDSSTMPRQIHANHLSPQALKWREYRRRNPLGLERVSGLAGLAGSLDRKQLQEPKPSKRSHLFDFPGSLQASNIHSRLNGHSVKQLQINYSDFFPDYFSLTEKPPAEFCLSPDSTTESVSIDLLQKKDLVKAINTAVDLIVAHFGTSRDPGVKAKLGNSSVSPNVGHLILKYLCPAIRNILSDGLKAYVLDMIIGQRRNTPWSVVEASTQLGPSTKVLHCLFSKISQYSELTNHTMRFNAFIFGLLNIRSLEFWVNHLYNHEDITLTHYQTVGFLSLSRSICQGFFEEVLLLLQPLSLLPFNLDLLFEHNLFQMGREQQQRKELLRVKQDLQHSVHSTLQLMRTRGDTEDSSGSWGPEADLDKGSREECISKSLGVEKVTSERLKGVGASVEESEKEQAQKNAKESTAEVKKDKQAGWWYQLMQSSQVYIEGSSQGPKFVRYEKKKKPGVNAATTEAEGGKAPPRREGVVDGAEACPSVEGAIVEREMPGMRADVSKVFVKELCKEEPKEKSRRSWMGSPPESVLNELKGNNAKETRTLQKESSAEHKLEAEDVKEVKDSPAPSEGSQSMKWGRLFGSRKQQGEARQTNRHPSNWLSLDSSVLQLMVHTVGAGIWRDAPCEEGEKLQKEPSQEQNSPRDLRLSPCTPQAVKALCHHIATEPGQMSFKKGDILQVNSVVDNEWLHCGLGSENGLVPWMYVSRLNDKDN